MRIFLRILRQNRGAKKPLHQILLFKTCVVQQVRTKYLLHLKIAHQIGMLAVLFYSIFELCFN